MYKQLIAATALLFVALNAGAENQNSRSGQKYGTNIISAAPIQMTNHSPSGIGIQFEHFLDRKGQFALYFPMALSFYKDNYYTIGPKSRVYTYFYPGMKIYPAGSHHKVSYSVGPSLAFGFGNQYAMRTLFEPNGHMSSYLVEDNVFRAGFVVNNGLNIQPTPAFYMGLELGLGMLYYSSAETYGGEFNDPLVQFQFKMGYRF